jgi:hypothetical protein
MAVILVLPKQTGWIYSGFCALRARERDFF